MVRIFQTVVLTIALITFSVNAITISGIVSDTKGQPITGAVVALRLQSLSDTTDSFGAFLLSGMDVVASVPHLSVKQQVSLAGSLLKIYLPEPSSLHLELFDCRGRRLVYEVQQRVAAGSCHVDLAEYDFTSGMMFIRVTTGNYAAIVRYVPLEKSGQAAIASSPKGHSVKEGGLLKIRKVVDSLVVKAGGYRQKSIPVFNYDTLVAVSLEKEAPVPYGSFLITLKTEENAATLMGRLYDGPVLSVPLWDEAMVAEPYRVLVPQDPFCSKVCGSGAVCVASDSCQSYPLNLLVGKVLVTGLKTSDGKNSFELTHQNFIYRSSALAYPPFAAGATVSVAATQTETPFTLSAAGIDPLVVLNGTVTVADGQPLTLRWTPPGRPGGSVIDVEVEFTSEGVQKAKLQGTCADTGSLTIPSKLLDKLKTYGISGYPTLNLTRRSTGSNEGGTVQLVIESTVTIFLQIPGVISCTSDIDCPDGASCGTDMRCR